MSQEGDSAQADTENLEGEAAVPRFDLPSFSQVDMSVFDALPADVQEELKAEYKRRSVSPAIPPQKVSTPPGMRIKRMNSNLARIPRQTAPRSKIGLLPLKSRLLAPRAGASAVRVDNAELRRLEIDPGVFEALPHNVQREQLAHARGAQAVVSVTPRGPLKPPRPWGRRSRTPGSIIPPPPPPNACFVQPPVLRQPGPVRGETVSFWKMEDVQGLLEEWVHGFSEHAPHEKDVEYFAKFLVRCAETDVGIERAVGLMRWWAILLRRIWGVWEHVKDLDEEEQLTAMDESVTSEMIGRAWWRAFREIKTRMDQVARKRFSGSLSLK